jgi:hypothetical protein
MKRPGASGRARPARALHPRGSGPEAAHAIAGQAANGSAGVPWLASPRGPVLTLAVRGHPPVDMGAASRLPTPSGSGSVGQPSGRSRPPTTRAQRRRRLIRPGRWAGSPTGSTGHPRGSCHQGPWAGPPASHLGAHVDGSGASSASRSTPRAGPRTRHRPTRRDRGVRPGQGRSVRPPPRPASVADLRGARSERRRARPADRRGTPPGTAWRRGRGRGRAPPAHAAHSPWSRQPRSGVFHVKRRADRRTPAQAGRARAPLSPHRPHRPAGHPPHHPTVRASPPGGRAGAPRTARTPSLGLAPRAGRRSAHGWTSPPTAPPELAARSRGTRPASRCRPDGSPAGAV